ncbi:acyl-CoA synthetase [Saccharopolyspora rhizosphaerae]|uniref:Acyl-CoA synthetase n=2 Tax=Saccharopolyspora rhizosphaerae TaxID=2492662 RepID=A0A3R8P0W1_9PSEU|nr:acyl-CoA synthetase [Saccharopolyspora rhizosphaerae]
MLDELVRRDPDATLAIDAHPERPITVRRAELRDRVQRLRTELADAGLGRGDCLAVWLPNWSDSLVFQFAAASLGAHVVGLNTRYNVEEVTHVLQRSRPAVLAIAHDFHGLDLIATLRDAVRTAGTTAPPPAVVVVPGPHGRPCEDPTHYDVGAGAWTPSDAAAPSPGAHEHDELAVAFTTSGSTGKPKLAAHTASAVVSHARADADGMGIRDSDVVLCALPLSGVFGFSTAMAGLAGGAACLLEPVFDEDGVVADMARWGVTHVVAADDMLTRIAAAWRRHALDLSRWRWLGIADFLGRSHEVAAWARDEFGTLTSGVYGSSEVFALACFWPDDEPAPRRWTGGGHLVSGEMQARTADPATDEVTAPGEQGELHLRGPNVVDAYLGSPEAAESSFTADGWFKTGDLAEIDEDGAIRYVCRIGDVLRLRGFLVDPAEIEHRLAAHPAVTTAKVVGARVGDGSTLAVGFVVLAPGEVATDQDLRDWCAAALARFKVPTAVHVLDRMPTTSGTNGTKIRAATLREWAQQWHAEVAR